MAKRLKSHSKYVGKCHVRASQNTYHRQNDNSKIATKKPTTTNSTLPLALRDKSQWAWAFARLNVCYSHSDAHKCFAVVTARRARVQKCHTPLCVFHTWQLVVVQTSLDGACTHTYNLPSEYIVRLGHTFRLDTYTFICVCSRFYFTSAPLA